MSNSKTIVAINRGLSIKLPSSPCLRSMEYVWCVTSLTYAVLAVITATQWRQTKCHLHLHYSIRICKYQFFISPISKNCCGRKKVGYWCAYVVGYNHKSVLVKLIAVKSGNVTEEKGNVFKKCAMFRSLFFAFAVFLSKSLLYLVKNLSCWNGPS